MRNIIGYGGGKGGGSSSTPTEAPDSLHSIAYARVLDLVSEGEIGGLVNGLQSIFLEGTPLANADGTLNFQNVAVDYRPGAQDQDAIPGFPSVENETAVGVELTATAPWVRAVTNTQLSAVRVQLSVPALSRADSLPGRHCLVDGIDIAPSWETKRRIRGPQIVVRGLLVGSRSLTANDVERRVALRVRR